MPALKPRQERFAQAIAAGKPPIEAYRLAGYKPDAGNASHLQADHKISQRITDLLAERERRAAKSLERATEIIALSKADIFRMLLDDRDLARDLGQSATAATVDKLLGQELHGMFIDRKHITHASAPAAEMEFEQLLAIAQGRVIEHQTTDITETPEDDGEKT